LEQRKKKNPNWKKFYWVMVVTIFIALIFLVRFVLNSSKIYVDESTAINPFVIEWSLERDGSLRINEPYYLDTRAKFIEQNLDKLQVDSSIYVPLISDTKTESSLADIKHPYLLWKNANSDTIHVLKNNIHLNFQLYQP
jgi:hypothetical protein